MELNLLNVIFHHLADPTGKSVGLLYVLSLLFSELILCVVGCSLKISCVFFLGSSSYIYLLNNLIIIICLIILSVSIPVFQFSSLIQSSISVGLHLSVTNLLYFHT